MYEAARRSGGGPGTSWLLFLHFSSFPILCLLLVFKYDKSSSTENSPQFFGGSIMMKSVKSFTLFLTLLTALGSAQLMFGQVRPSTLGS